MCKYILYVGEMELPDKNAASQRVLANCKIIQQVTSCNVVIIGLNSSIKHDSEYEILNTYYSLDEFYVYEYPYPKTSIQWFKYITKINYIKTVVKYIGVNRIKGIVAYNYPAIALERLRQYCSKNNIVIISDATEWYGKSLRTFPSNKVKDFDTFLRMTFVNRKCHNIICASNFLQNYYKNQGCNTMNIPSLVDETSSKFTTQIRNSNRSVRVYSYVGSPGKSREKDRLDWIINSFYKLKKSGYKFKIILAGVDKKSLLKYYPELKIKVRELNNYLEFKGRVSHDVAIEIISNSDFTIFTREINRVTSAGFPTKLAESYACKIPVVTTPSSNVKEYIINGKTGFVADICEENSFYEVLRKSVLIRYEDISYMKKYLSEHNPMSIDNFFEPCKHFFDKLL